MKKFFRSRTVLFLAFAFAVMADPVSSVAYAVEAALRSLHGDLALLLPTMGVVVAIIALVIVNYRQLIDRYPQGGGASAAVGEAFGDAWGFIPIGALVVDFVLTIAISVSAGASAIIAYAPALAPARIPLALTLVIVVAGLTYFGHLGRVIFALLTIGFITVTAIVLVQGLWATPGVDPSLTSDPGVPPVFAVILAFPVAMALATGVEAPSSAIAQLGELDDAGRRRFGRRTLVLTLIVVGTITLGLAAEAVHLRVGIPGADSTLIADLAQRASSPEVFAAFQILTALLLLSAASSSFQAGPGLLKALARTVGTNENDAGVLPEQLGRTNRFRTPVYGVIIFAILALVITALAGGNDQILVLFYAVSVFLSFLAGLLAMTKFSLEDRAVGRVIMNVVGVAIVSFTLVVNLLRVTPLVSLAVSLAISGALYALWVRAGRPEGIRNAGAAGETLSDRLDPGGRENG